MATGSTDDAYRPVLPPMVRPQPSSILTHFQAGHGFTNSAGSTFTANDTTDFAMGTQATKIVSGGTGVAANVSNTALPTFDTTNKLVRVVLKVDDITHLVGLNLFLGASGGFTNYYKWIIQGGAVSSNYVVSGEWVTITLNWHDATVTGAPSRSSLGSIRLQATDDNTANPVTVHCQAIELIPDAASRFPNGVVSICFDDGWQSAFDYGKPKLDAYGYPASIYTIADIVGTASRVTLPELQAARDEGWEIAAHAYADTVHAASYTAVTAATLNSDVASMRGYLVDNGFPGLDGFAYPLGQYGKTTDGVSTTALMRQFYSYARTTSSKTKETLPPADAYRLRAASDISAAAGGRTPTSLTTAGTGDLAVAKTNQSWLILVFHKIVTGTAANTLEIKQTDFDSIIDAINSQGIPVRTVGDVIRSFGQTT